MYNMKYNKYINNNKGKIKEGRYIMKIKNNKINQKYLMLVTILFALMAVTTIASSIVIRSSVQIAELNNMNIVKNQKMNFDINHNGVIDQGDLNEVIECFNQVGRPGWIAEDINTDGTVDMYDISLMNSALYKYDKPFPQRDTTYVNVEPSSQIIDGGETSSITVRLVPGEPVIGVQIDLTFDHNLIQITNVNCPNIGLIWDFYFPPSIDNINGEIHGAGVVAFGVLATYPIDCFTITFTAQSTSGISPLTLHDVIVTDQNAQPIVATINSGSVEIDNTDPVVSITSPSIGSFLKGTVSVTATITEVNLDTISVRIDSTEVATSLPYSWVTTGYSDGSHSVQILATDEAGNIGSDSVTVTVDNTAPSVDAGADMVIKVATQKTDASASDVTSGVATILWTYPANVICSNSGVINPTFSASIDGVYTVMLTVTDYAGNSAVDTFQLTWDTAAPVVNAGVDQIKKALFTQDATVSDPAPSSGIMTYAWTKVSGPGTITFGSPAAEDTTVTAGADGTYVLRLTVTDNAENSAFDEFTLTWDTVNPTITNIVVTTSNPIDTIIGWVNFTCTVTDSLSGINEVFLYVDGTPILMQHTGSLYYYNYTLGSGHHTYYIYATDEADNSQTSVTNPISIAPNWDITMDGVVNVMDVSAISVNWLHTGTPGWIREDINNDGAVNILDVSAISVHWLETW